MQISLCVLDRRTVGQGRSIGNIGLCKLCDAGNLIAKMENAIFLKMENIDF